MSVLIVVTRLRLSDPRHRGKFLKAAAEAIKQSTTTSGNLGSDVLPEANDVYWTRTAWNDRDSMLAFMTADTSWSESGSAPGWPVMAPFETIIVQASRSKNSMMMNSPYFWKITGPPGSGRCTGYP